MVFIGFFFTTGGFSILSIVVILVFVLIAILPVLLSPRSYEFYDSSLKIHKIVGGDSEIPYSGLTLYEAATTGRRPQVVMTVAGQRRPIVIQGNPTNKETGQTLNQFLGTRLKKYNPQAKENEEESPSTETEAEADASEDVDTTRDQAQGY